MKKYFFAIITLLSINACKDTKTQETSETHTTGSTTIWVDESIAPLAEDITTVFERYYDRASIEIKTSNATSITNSLLKNDISLAMISRDLTEKEIKHISQRIAPTIIPVAKEAVVFITHKTNKDSLLNFQKFLLELKEPNSDKIIVFDNANSTITKMIQEQGEIDFNQKNMYYMNNTKEVIEYISQNPKAIGIVGSNWMLNMYDNNEENIAHLRTMKLWNETQKQYIKPSQSTLADNTYPLVRTVNIVDIKGAAGLGRGLASFAASDKGQRIVLKSGLMPIEIPPREIVVK